MKPGSYPGTGRTARIAHGGPGRRVRGAFAAGIQVAASRFGGWCLSLPVRLISSYAQNAMSEARKRPLHARGFRVGWRMPPLLSAVVSSAVVVYMGAGGVLVAVRAQRHFSATAWIIV